MLLRLCVSTLLVAISACAAKRDVIFVAASNETITARLEVTGDGNGQRVVVNNASTVEITVTSVMLKDCENLKNRCDVVPMRTAVGPGQNREVLVVRPRVLDKGYNFRYSWTWEAKNSLPQISQ